jgi:hypothetical protein
MFAQASKPISPVPETPRKPDDPLRRAFDDPRRPEREALPAHYVLHRLLPRRKDPLCPPTEAQIIDATGDMLFFLMTSGGVFTQEERAAYRRCFYLPFCFLPDDLNFMLVCSLPSRFPHPPPSISRQLNPLLYLLL